MHMKNRFVIIIDGPDYSGKTHIARALCDRIGAQYFKNFSEKTRFLDTDTIHDHCMVEARYLINMLEQINFDKNGIVLDRHIPSHFAYSKAYNRPYIFSDIMEIDVKLAEFGAVLIYCHKDFGPGAVYMDEFVNRSTLSVLNFYFTNYCRFTKMPHITIDTTDQNLMVQLTTIVKFLNTLEEGS